MMTSSSLTEGKRIKCKMITRDKISASALNTMWCRASAGMTDPKDTHLTSRNLRICQKYREDCPFSMKIGLIWTAIKERV
jgi:hypothetical protein